MNWGLRCAWTSATLCVVLAAKLLASCGLRPPRELCEILWAARYPLLIGIGTSRGSPHPAFGHLLPREKERISLTKEKGSRRLAGERERSPFPSCESVAYKRNLCVTSFVVRQCLTYPFVSTLVDLLVGHVDACALDGIVEGSYDVAGGVGQMGFEDDL